MHAVRTVNKRLAVSGAHYSPNGITGVAASQQSFIPQVESATMNVNMYPLPGDITTFQHYQSSNVAKANIGSNNINVPMNELTVFGELAKPDFSKQLKEEIDFVVVEAPNMSKKEFVSLFPDRKAQILNKNLTIVTVAQNTETDQRAWSEAMETERELLTAKFIDTAISIVDSLRAEGYWADFIDPSSGRPYLGSFTNDILFETDPRLRRLAGTYIDDLGCCKVVCHPLWGTHVFTNTIFTDAPVNSPILQMMKH